MKNYIFTNGDIKAENLDGEAIKKYEKVLGELEGVVTAEGYIPVIKDQIKITYKGESHTFKEWAEITGINERTLRARYGKGERDYILFRSVGT